MRYLPTLLLCIAPLAAALPSTMLYRTRSLRLTARPRLHLTGTRLFAEEPPLTEATAPVAIPGPVSVGRARADGSSVSDAVAAASANLVVTQEKLKESQLQAHTLSSPELTVSNRNAMVFELMCAEARESVDGRPKK